MILRWFFCIGGAADKSKILKVGDEILSVNNADCTRMSRIEAWNFMKKLSEGTASIIVRQKLPKEEETQDLATKSNQDDQTQKESESITE